MAKPAAASLASRRRKPPELILLESGLWAILVRTGPGVSIVETGHLDRRLAARDLVSWKKFGRLSRIGQAWLAAATRLQRNVATRKYQVGGVSITRLDILRLLMKQDYRCPS